MINDVSQKITINTLPNNKTIFKQPQEQNNLKQTSVIVGSSILGMTPVLATLAHKKGFSLNPMKIIKTPIKDWALLKYKPTSHSIEFEESQIIATATGSVIGGYIGGSIVDKQNEKAKRREILNQVLGNVIVPVSCVGLGSRFYSKYADSLKNTMPQIKKSGKLVSVVNMALKNIPNAIGTLAFLSVGIYIGNKVSNLINEKLYHKKVDRNIKPSDFAPHFDDLCMSVSMMNRASDFGSKLGRIIPLALFVPGYETGTAKNNE